MHKNFLLPCFLLSFGLHSYSQVPTFEWSRCLGGSGRDAAHSILPTPDGGSLVGGSSMSTDGDITCQHDTLGWWDFWLARLDSSGNLLWTQCYGGSQTETSYDVKPTADGGYILCGNAISTNGDVSGNHGGIADAWVVKVDYMGTLEWQKCFGGTALDVAREIIQTSDGGYAFVGYTLSNNGDVSGHHDTVTSDIWVLKMDSAGNTEWSRCLGGTNYEDGYGIVQTTDGNFWIAGESWSTDFDATGNHGYYDFFVARLDSASNVTYAHCYGGSDQDIGRGLLETDEGLVLYGQSGSSNGDVVGHINFFDDWIVCIDTSGTILWQKVLGGASHEGINNGKSTADGGFIFTGYSQSNTGQVSGNHGFSDAWTVKTDSIGNLQWQLSLGGTNEDESWAIAPLSNGKFLTALTTQSNDGNIYNSHGDDEIWVAQLSSVYNTMTGLIYYDANANNLFDSGDASLANRKITETTTGRIAFSSSDGTFSIHAFAAGSYTLVPDTIPMFIAQPSSHPAVFLSASGQTDTLNDFAIVPDTVPVIDLELDLYAMAAFRPGFSGFYGARCKNKGNLPQSGELVVRHDTSLLFVSSTVTPTSVTPDSVVIPIDTLQPFGETFVMLQYLVKSTTPIGTLVTSTATLNPVAGDANPADNESTANTVVRGSYDPNDKTVSRDYILTTEVSNRPVLDYKVRFQNTGNDTAFNIVVLDTLSPLLDVQTLSLEASSHAVAVDYANDSRVLKFTFSNILLPDSNTNEMMSHGMVVYSIRPYGTLQAGDVIRNAAAIYFDFNAAVATNAVYTPVIVPSGISSPGKMESLLLYPNPAKDEIRIRMPGKFLSGTVEIFNFMGQQIRKAEIKQQNEISIPLHGLPNGVYIVKVTNGEKIMRATFVVGK